MDVFASGEYAPSFVETAYSHSTIALPLSPPDAHDQSTVLSLFVNVIDGAFGIVNAITALVAEDWFDVIPEPERFTTVNVYSVPAVNTPELKVIGEELALAVNEPGDDVATYAPVGGFPGFVDSVNDIVAPPAADVVVPAIADADTPVGTVGNLELAPGCERGPTGIPNSLGHQLHTSR